MSAVNPRADSALVSPKLKTTSLKVAKCFGKRHRDVLRDIRNLDIPDDFTMRNFAHREQIQQHRTGSTRQTIVEMTRDGFMILAMGFTGKAAMEWKIKYLQAFNAMEAALINQAPQIAPRAPAALPAPPTLTNAQARTIQKLIAERWPDQDAREAAYGRLKDRFQVTRYRDIARSDFDTAVDFITSEQPARTVTLTLPIESPENFADQDSDRGRIATAFSLALFYVENHARLHSRLAGELQAVGEHVRRCAEAMDLREARS